ncbi:MAG: ATP-binding protein [Nevskiales bacterium]|nr:ATP-binding protein [Nevskiales bacterium]
MTSLLFGILAAALVTGAWLPPDLAWLPWAVFGLAALAGLWRTLRNHKLGGDATSAATMAQVNEHLHREVMLREAAERNLRQTLSELRRAAAEHEQFAYVASHDLQAPLRNVAGFAQLLRTKYSKTLDPQAGEFLDYIQQGVAQMQDLINALLQLSRVGRLGGQLESRPLAETLGKATRMLASDIERSGARISAPDLPVVTADHQLLAQLFQNLISNALKFQPEGNAPVITIECRRERDDWHIVVRDNGIGIPVDQLEQVFAVFKRLHAAERYAGTGIGLAICRKIAVYHGGEMWAEPCASGAEFHLRLPVEPPVTRAGPKPANS